MLHKVDRWVDVSIGFEHEPVIKSDETVENK